MSFEATTAWGRTITVQLESQPVIQEIGPRATILDPGENHNETVCISPLSWEGAAQLPHQGKIRLRAIYRNTHSPYDPHQSMHVWVGTLKSAEREFTIRESQ